MFCLPKCVFPRELRSEGVSVVEPTSGYYIFPNFEVIRPALQKRGILTCQGMCDLMLSEIAVAVSCHHYQASSLNWSSVMRLTLFVLHLHGAHRHIFFLANFMMLSTHIYRCLLIASFPFTYPFSTSFNKNLRLYIPGVF